MKAEVRPHQKDRTYHHKAVYSSWIVIRKDPFEISTALCECQGGWVIHAGPDSLLSFALWESGPRYQFGENPWVVKLLRFHCLLYIQLFSIAMGRNVVRCWLPKDINYLFVKPLHFLLIVVMVHANICLLLCMSWRPWSLFRAHQASAGGSRVQKHMTNPPPSLKWRSSQPSKLCHVILRKYQKHCYK